MADFSGDPGRASRRKQAQKGATVERYTKAQEAMTDLERGVLDAVVTDVAPSRVFAEKMGLVVVEDPEFPLEYYGIAMRSEDTEAMQVVNDGIAALIDAGLLDELYTTYSEGNVAAE